MRRSVSSEEDTVVLASQKSTEKLPKNAKIVAEDAEALKNLVASQKQIKETTSTIESARDTQSAEFTSFKSAESAWCVTLPSESVLLFDSLTEFLESFGKTLIV